MFSDKQVLRDMLECVANNFHVKAAQGKRYKASVQQFFAVLIWGGPRLAYFVAQNLFGPETHSIYRWRQSKSHSFEQGKRPENVQTIASIYKDAKQDLSLQTAIPVMLAED